MATKKQESEQDQSVLTAPPAPPTAPATPATDAPLKAGQKPTHYRIKIGKPPGEKASKIVVIANTVKYELPYDEMVTVPAVVWGILNDATEPYPHVVQEANGARRVERRLRKRFNVVDSPVV